MNEQQLLEEMEGIRHDFLEDCDADKLAGKLAEAYQHLRSVSGFTAISTEYRTALVIYHELRMYAHHTEEQNSLNLELLKDMKEMRILN